MKLLADLYWELFRKSYQRVAFTTAGKCSRLSLKPSGLFENSDQSSMCLGLTCNAKTNGGHFFPRVFHSRLLPASRQSLVVTMIYVSRLLFVIDISGQMVCAVDDSAHKRGDFTNNQRVYRENAFLPKKAEKNISELRRSEK